MEYITKQESTHPLIQQQPSPCAGRTEIEPVTVLCSPEFVLQHESLKLLLYEKRAEIFVIALVKGQPQEMQKPTQERDMEQNQRGEKGRMLC